MAPVESSSVSEPPRFPGLDTLRGVAALVVLVSHFPKNLERAGLPLAVDVIFLDRGFEAVSFFLTLSGFLITYLLLAERARFGTVDVSAFYGRRALRIWPLYFAVVGLGLLLNLKAAELGFRHHPNYPASATLFYVVFLPNLMNALYTIGLILGPMWSIGVEEQFYLAWAPLMKRWCGRLMPISVVVLVISLVGHIALLPFRGQVPGVKITYLLPRFHFLAAGALAAWALSHHRDRLLALPVFRRRFLQALLWFWIAQFYLVGMLSLPSWGNELFQLLVYPWLILECGANPAALFAIGWRGTEWLGRISYSLYMLHQVGLWIVSALFSRWGGWSGSPSLFAFTYYPTAIVVCIALAAVSYRFFELPLLRLKYRFAPAPA